MDNTCVMCGRELPTESSSMVCDKCSNSEYKLCPNCGGDTEIMSQEVYQTFDGVCKSTIYHCSICGRDWEQEVSYVEKRSVFRPKFWG